MAARKKVVRSTAPSTVSYVLMGVSILAIFFAGWRMLRMRPSLHLLQQQSPLYVCADCGTPNVFNNPKTNHPETQNNADNFAPVITALKPAAYFPIIELPRLRLRPVTMDDLSRLHRFFQKGSNEQSSGWVRHKSVEETRQKINDIVSKYRSGDTEHWGIALKDTDEIIGLGGFTGMVPGHQRATIGWWIDSDYWGRGYATEIGKGLIEFGMKIFKLNRIDAVVKVHNIASQRVLRKVGMNYVATHRRYWELKEHVNDYHLFVIVRKDIESQLAKSDIAWNI